MNAIPSRCPRSLYPHSDDLSTIFMNNYVSQNSFSTAEKAVVEAIEAEVEEQLRNPPEPEHAGEEGGTDEDPEEEESTDDEEVETEEDGVDEVDVNRQLVG